MGNGSKVWANIWQWLQNLEKNEAMASEFRQINIAMTPEMGQRYRAMAQKFGPRYGTMALWSFCLFCPNSGALAW